MVSSFFFFFFLITTHSYHIKISNSFFNPHFQPEGHLLQDIYKSVQRRNIVEPRVKQKYVIVSQ